MDYKLCYIYADISYDISYFLFLMNQTYQIIMIMVISVKTFEYDAWNKANKIITNLHNLVADIIMTLKFP